MVVLGLRLEEWLLIAGLVCLEVVVLTLVARAARRHGLDSARWVVTVLVLHVFGLVLFVVALDRAKRAPVILSSTALD